MTPAYRVGLGWDIHRLEPSDNGVVPLAGVPIPCAYRVIAHSDGDVVLHAVCDALLGAVAAGDLGQHFPDTSDAHANRASHEFVTAVLALPELADWSINNVDINIIAQTPRLAEHRLSMRTRLSELLAIPLNCVSIKARTSEGVDAVGNKQAIACQAIVALNHSA